MPRASSRSEDELAFLSIPEAARLLRRKEISPVELVEAALARIERWNPAINAFLTVLAERARREARAAERALLRGHAKSPLHGIPISLKDNYWTRGVRTTAGSRILANFIPDRDSEVAARLAQAGAILLGKTNLHEFAYGATNENVHYGPVRNPWYRERISGGSSGGSAAAVAAGMGFASMGSDTGGSIRIPSVLCGVVGLKPTYGLVSVDGLVPLSRTLDHAGPIARNVTDICILLEAVAGNFPEGFATPNHRALGKTRAKRIRLGRPRHYFFDRLDDEVRRGVEAAAATFQSLGADIREVSLATLADAVEPSTNIALAEATAYHESEGYFPARAAEYGEGILRRLEMGREVRAADYLRAFEVKQQVTDEFEAALAKVDAIFAPGLPIAAPALGQKEVAIGGEKEPVRAALIRLNRPANFTGHPAISMPCGSTGDGLPVGIQLIGRHWGEARLLQIALAYEEATEWHNRHPHLT
ncbi:MAG TPA: amidase [Candidatus Sulfotelmatobacter sp.]|nr:amidase [Candidatus Sulfotelmatobacter sp.]